VSAAVRVDGELRSIAAVETPLGRVSIAVFVNSSCGPRAEDSRATLLARLLDDRR